MTQTPLTLGKLCVKCTHCYSRTEENKAVVRVVWLAPRSIRGYSIDPQPLGRRNQLPPSLLVHGKVLI